MAHFGKVGCSTLVECSFHKLFCNSCMLDAQYAGTSSSMALVFVSAGMSSNFVVKLLFGNPFEAIACFYFGWRTFGTL